MMIGESHGVCSKGNYLAIISTVKEKEDYKSDLKVAFDLLGEISY
jgi:RAB protein geranylgeranyltransferase component A